LRIQELSSPCQYFLLGCLIGVCQRVLGSEQVKHRDSMRRFVSAKAGDAALDGR